MRSKRLVYGLVDPRTRLLRYVGKSSSGLTRPKSHFYPCRLNDRTHMARWVRSVVVAGLKPEIVVLEEVDSESALNEAEEFYIGYFKFIGCPLTNATVGGEGATGVVPSEVTRAKMSAARKGRKFTETHRASIAAALQGHEVSEVTRMKIGVAHKGNRYCAGRVLSPESRAKMSDSVKMTSPARGVPRSEEVRAKIRMAVAKRQRRADGTFEPKNPNE